MTQFQMATTVLLDTFNKYAKAAGDKDKNTLTKAEFQTFLDNEFPTLNKGQVGQDVSGTMMKALDANKDNRIDFQEYMSLVGALIFGMYEMRNK